MAFAEVDRTPAHRTHRRGARIGLGSRGPGRKQVTTTAVYVHANETAANGQVTIEIVPAKSGGGGGNRTSGDPPGSDDSRTVSGTGIGENTSKEHEENALPDILMTMSQIPLPDVSARPRGGVGVALVVWCREA